MACKTCLVHRCPQIHMTFSLLIMSRWMVRRISRSDGVLSQILQSVGCWQAVVSSYLTHLTKSNTFTACDIIIVISIEVVLRESHCTSEYIRTLTALNYEREAS